MKMADFHQTQTPPDGNKRTSMCYRHFNNSIISLFLPNGFRFHIQTFVHCMYQQQPTHILQITDGQLYLYQAFA